MSTPSQLEALVIGKMRTAAETTQQNNRLVCKVFGALVFINDRSCDPFYRRRQKYKNGVRKTVAALAFGLASFTLCECPARPPVAGSFLWRHFGRRRRVGRICRVQPFTTHKLFADKSYGPHTWSSPGRRCAFFGGAPSGTAQSTDILLHRRVGITGYIVFGFTR